MGGCYYENVGVVVVGIKQPHQWFYGCNRVCGSFSKIMTVGKVTKI